MDKLLISEKKNKSVYQFQTLMIVIIIFLFFLNEI